MRKIGLVLFLSCIIFSCGSKKAAVRKREAKKENTEHVVISKKTDDNTIIQETQNEINNTVTREIKTTEDYLAMFSAVAQEEMRLYSIPASITLAQGILESNSGKGRLSVEANNHFGIKCHDWTGDKIYHDDDALQECFRKYIDAKYSFRDHSLFLTGRQRYSDLFNLKKDDYKAWAKGLKAAGYATDRKYPDKLISLIERYQLYKFDDEVLGSIDRDENKTSFSEPEKTTYVVVKGDTLYSISKKYNMSVKELQDLNGLKDTTISIGQDLNVKP